LVAEQSQFTVLGFICLVEMGTNDLEFTRLWNIICDNQGQTLTYFEEDLKISIEQIKDCFNYVLHDYKRAVTIGKAGTKYPALQCSQTTKCTKAYWTRYQSCHVRLSKNLELFPCPNEETHPAPLNSECSDNKFLGKMRNLNGNFRFMSKLKEQDFCFSKEGG
jgi:hypothetical protein